MSFDHLKVAVLGLSFKPGTDDLREAPSLDNVKLLLDAGAEITAYDPVAADNFQKRFPAVTMKDSPEEALAGASVCFVFTEWQEIVRLSPDAFKKHMRIPLVYDGRNIFDPAAMQAAGVEYHSIGR